jgi:hypothetical protein
MSFATKGEACAGLVGGLKRKANLAPTLWMAQLNPGRSPPALMRSEKS